MILHHHRIEPTLGSELDMRHFEAHLAEDERRQHTRRRRVVPGALVGIAILAVSAWLVFEAVFAFLEHLQRVVP